MSRNPKSLAVRRQTDAPEFRTWFDGSKVVGPKGRPLPVYHGTSEDFEIFDGNRSDSQSRTGAPKGSFFFSSSPDIADSYAVAWQGDFSKQYKDGANLMPAYLSLKNPLKVDAKGENWQDIQYKGRFYDINELVAKAQREEYDGLIVRRVQDKGRGDVEADVATTYVAFKPSQIKSVTGNAGSFDPTNPDIRFSFAGPRSALADHCTLKAAQERLASGENAQEVRKEVGWFLGPDGKMRYEIDDSKACFATSVFFAGKFYPSRFLADARDRAQAGGVGTLGGVLEHPELFDAYPVLRSIRVVARIREGDEQGSFDGRKIDAQAPTKEQLMAVILHEVQHVIQVFEGFAMGGNSESARSAELQRMRIKRREINEAIIDLGRERGGMKPSDDFEYQRNVARHKELVAQRDSLDVQEQSLKHDLAPAANAYKRLAGEVEARNVMARKGMSSCERKEVSPQETADVREEDLLIVFDDSYRIYCVERGGGR